MSRDVVLPDDGTELDGYARTAYPNVPMVIHEAPTWAQPVPPTHAAFGSAIQRWWSWIVRWPRYLAVVLLWCTEYWHRFVLATCVLASLVLVYVTR